MLNRKSASAKDIESIASLLKADKLCFNDINEDGVSLFVVEKNNVIVGYFGFEIFDLDALFRSLIVQPEHRGKGYGQEIWQLALESMVEAGVKDIYLLTNTAEDFFGKLDFEKYARNAVPEKIGGTAEFADFCSEDSICMHYKVKASK